MLHLLKELQRTNDIGLMIITHNLGVVWDVCDRAMVMYAGKVVEAADVKSLYAKPMHPYTWGLLDSMPSLSSERKADLSTIPRGHRLTCALRARRATSPTAAPMRRTFAARKFPSSSKSSRGISSPAIGRRSMRISSA